MSDGVGGAEVGAEREIVTGEGTATEREAIETEIVTGRERGTERETERGTGIGIEGDRGLDQERGGGEVEAVAGNILYLLYMYECTKLVVRWYMCYGAN